ncbi:MAG: 50S ribosomal protein L11 methyltransferase [Vicinamibacteria bacterium]
MALAFLAVVRPSDEDVACALFHELRTLGLELSTTPSGDSALIAYFDERPGLEAELREAFARLRGASLSPHAVPEVDWVARFREGFAAFDAGPFRIVPEWQRTGSPGPREIVVDPGQAFGTGTHETTRLCLVEIALHAARGPLGLVADVGTGTGILGVAALKLGASLAVGVDDDPVAIAQARRHAELNAAPLRLVLGDGAAALRPGRFKLVLANLMAPLLLARRAELCALRAPAGALVLSGLLVSDLPEITRAFAAAGPIRTREDGEWAAVCVGAA